jgi:hypothetical protein
MRPTWESLPHSVRAALQDVLGFSVVRAESQRGGFSPGVAARVYGRPHERAFVKAVSSEVNDLSPQMHRDEAVYAALLPAGHPSPRLLGSCEVGPWVGLAFEHVDGHEPGRPWTSADLDAAVAALDRQAQVLAVPELPTVFDSHRLELEGWRQLAAASPVGLTDWEARHLDDLASLEPAWADAAAGDRWLHLDTRGDNLLVLADGSAVLVDWPGSSAGNPVFDALAFVPAAIRDGALGVVPPGTSVFDVAPDVLAQGCEELFGRFACAPGASPDGLTALVCAFAGLMQWRMRQPPPPGLPTVRAFQASQGVVALAWLQHRLHQP